MASVLGPKRPDLRQERIFSHSRPRRRFAVVAALLAMLLSAGALWAAYRAATRPPPPGEVPLIRADDQPIRKRPSDPGGMTIPGQGTLVLDGGRGEPKVEQILPPPETPLPRPAPAEPPAETPAAPPPGAAANAPATAAPSPPPPAAPSAAAPAPAPEPKPAPAAAAPPPPAAKAEAKGYRLQLGAVRTPEGAKQEWERLKREHRDLLGALGFSAPRVDLGERGVFYRIQAGPVADAAAAERDCRELKRRGVRCILVKP
jgi:cell division septation protein DedD